ncbi:hypothetical protein HZY62_21125 [Maribacter polysiphoniae]|uniref:Lipoprotein n=1 Tax=Maribacter polysiphoniae TaxID=429344 RepID=A0A316DML4_9FLAO|nr:hypothetical protein [Maribacter polysiphoniae]MBD1263105.1 hypothetical protein [Maribacter polysiphoniae]PWK18802.1 hypothetical protein LX92_04267 [Maribacter polysiphoniae]
MKTKLFITIAFLSLLLTSCIKDYLGDTGGDKIELNSENYLYDGDLERIFLEEQIDRLTDEIAQLNEIAQLDENDPKIEELIKQRVNFKDRLAQIIDLSAVGLDLVIPCDTPNGKCVPRLLEYFVFYKNIEQAVVYVKNINGENIGISDKLTPLPEFKNELQYIRVPVDSHAKGIIIEIIKKDDQGNEITSTVTLNR